MGASKNLGNRIMPIMANKDVIHHGKSNTLTKVMSENNNRNLPGKYENMP